MIFKKLRPKQSLGRCLYHPSASCSGRSKQKSEQEQEELLSCHDHAILVIAVENNRTLGIIEIMVHDELNASFSFHRELFWKIMVPCF